MSDFLQSFVVFSSLSVIFSSLFQSIDKLCHLSVIFCSLFQSVSVNSPFRVCAFLFWSNFPRYDDCSPFSQLSKCGEITLFGVVFMEKNTKNKKKAGGEKNLLPYISTMGELQNIIQTDLGSYSKGLQLSFFFLFLELGHVTITLMMHQDPDRCNQ